MHRANSAMDIECVQGAAIAPYLDALADLRIRVFREYPYLYEGSREYEAEYLRNYASCSRSLVVLARAGGRIVGASTAMPLTEHGEEGIAPALERAGFQPDQVFYFGESVLLPEFRGQGLGHVFFDQREAVAREQGMRYATFCAVARSDDHPRRPKDYVPHDAFWAKRGFVKSPDITASFSWRDLDEAEASPKTMVFWVKELR